MNRLNIYDLDRPKAKLVCVDPSKPGNNTGVAVFAGVELRACFLWTLPFAPHVGDGHVCSNADVVLIELPQVYPGARSEDPNDLIQVARAVGQWEQAAVDRFLTPPHGQISWRHPREWKGQVPKDIHNRRVLAALDASERALLDALKLPASKVHNVIDAIGMGLWVYGRIK